MPPAGFAVRRVCVLPGTARAYQAEDWRDSLVLVATGELELVGVCGSTHTCRAGDLIYLDGLPLCLLRNRGSATTLLVALSRASP